MEIWSARRIVLVCWQGVNTRGAKLLIVSLVSLWKVSRVYIVMRNIARSRSLEKLKITSLNLHSSHCLPNRKMLWFDLKRKSED